MEYINLLFIAGRSVIVYLVIILAIRLFGKKELAQLSIIDLVFILLISNSVQNAMVGSDTSLQGGLSAALGLFIINFLLKKIFYKHKEISNLVQGKPIILIYKGKIQLDHLQQIELTIDELYAALREHGFDQTDQIYLAMLEVDGNISFVSNEMGKFTSTHRKMRHKLKGKVLKV